MLNLVGCGTEFIVPPLIAGRGRLVYVGSLLAIAALVTMRTASASEFAPNTFLDLPADASDSYLTLREALQQANSTPGKDKISLQAGNYEVTVGKAPGSKSAYWAGAGVLKITDDVDIVGKGSTLTNIRLLPGSYGTSDRVIEVAPGVSVEIEGVGVGGGGWGGTATFGGGIFNDGKLTLRHCFIAHNAATDAGGAVYNRGQLEAVDTTFQYNEAGRNGGAIFNDVFATTKVTSSLIRDNSAGDANLTYGGYGGGVFNAWLGNTTIRNSTVESNHAVGTLGGHGGYGGGVFNQPWGSVTVVNDGVQNNYVHRFTSPGSYTSFQENFAGAPVWSYFEMKPMPLWPPWWWFP
ncbi:MAG: hypothetical protein PVH31_04990 [Ectothiorhodospiraceae bacterium]|jgi:hypothetical protein